MNFQPGETKTVTIPVKMSSLRRWNDDAKRYIVDPGDYELRVGPSSDKIESTLTLKVN